MKKALARKSTPMRKEYDFSTGVRGKYAGRFTPPVVTVVLDPDVAKFYPDGKSVNETLRLLAKLAKAQSKNK